MSQHESKAPVADATGTQEQPSVALFNPFTHLTAEQTAELIARLNPTWVKEHGQESADSMLEYGCTLGEATLYVWLKSTADDHIEAKLLTSKLDSSRKMLENISAGSMAAVAFIVEDYGKLKPASQRKFRISLRDAINGKFHGETALRVFDKISKAVGVPDVKQWMR